MERPPAVEGHFYPADPETLRGRVDGCLGDRQGEAITAVAVVVPHAGYVYSGATAGKVYAAVRIPERVLLLGPNHTGQGRPAAVWARGFWRTPLGRVPVDEELAAAVLTAHAALEEDEVAHHREHSLEVQIPFLQRLRAAVRIVPVCLADLGLPTLLAVGGALGEMLQQGPETLVVISSDMTHYESRQAARQKDRLAIRHLEQVDAEGLYRTIREHRISMCGVVPAVVGLAAARKCGASTGRLVDYTCSGDVTGDDQDVVAYAGLTVT